MDKQGRQRVRLAPLFFFLIFNIMKRWLWVLGGPIIAGLIFAANAFWKPPPPPPRSAPQIAQNIRVEILNGCGTSALQVQSGRNCAILALMS